MNIFANNPCAKNTKKFSIIAKKIDIFLQILLYAYFANVYGYEKC